MKKLLLGSLSLAALLALSGCGNDAKSVEDLQKLSKDELTQMSKACEAIVKADELAKEREKIANDILQARGLAPQKFGHYMAAASFTDEEVSKFGNSDFAEYVQCARVAKALKNAKGFR